MFLGAGVGAFSASIFHLVAHAFFKALLFLGAGSVIHAMGGEQDMRRMGGLKDKLPVTYWTFLVGSLAIAGIPPLAGFFSKDEILASAWGAGRPILWVVGSAVSLMTAFYMFRLFMLTFHGSFRGTAEQAHHLHESPRSMTIPLVALAVLSIVGGWIGIPVAIGRMLGVTNVIEHWLDPALAHDGAPAGSHDAPIVLLFVFATAVAVVGVGLAVALYRPGSRAPETAARASGPLYKLIANRWWVDELYDATVLRLYWLAAAAFDAFDRTVVDGTVNAAGVVAQAGGEVVRLTQTGLVRNYALLFLVGSAALLWYFIGS
jgi:NADH-quinone oxidoreductase subunit L